MNTILTIDRLGHRGDGIADLAGGPFYVAHTVPGDEVEIGRAGDDRGRLLNVLRPGADRVRAFEPGERICGGCGLSYISVPAQLAWKRDLVVAALRAEGIETEVAPCVDAHGAGRRRATFHARHGQAGMAVGFMEARSHDLIDLATHDCPTHLPEIQGSVELVRRICARGLHGRPSTDAVVTLTEGGLDIDLRGIGPVDDATRRALVDIAQKGGAARLSIHGDVLAEFRAPIVRLGTAGVHLPPGGFLQATEAGETALAGLVLDGIGKAKRVADLFAGIGTFALRIARRANVHAVEADGPAVAALQRAAGETPDLRPLIVERRDLMRRPLAGPELKDFDAVVFDPPRAGAEAQAKALAESAVPRVVAVSCNPTTLARDLAILTGGGYAIERVTPVDQFRHSAHVEAVAVLGKAPAPKPRRRVSLR